MLKFTLSNFYNNFTFFSFMDFLIHGRKEIFKEENIAFSYFEGNFPYCYWNGGYNNNYGKGAFYQDILEKVHLTTVPLRLNCSNVLLEDFDFNNVFGNLILSLSDTGSNIIEISNLKLMEYIKDKHPNYNYIFSKEAFLINELTPEIVNCITKNDKILLVSLPEFYNDNIEFLNSLEDKSKIEITLNPRCDINCTNFYNCHLNVHKTQIDYSGQDVFQLCQKNKRLQDSFILDFNEIKEKYQKLGINNFYINDNYHNENDYASFFISNFIKQEYQISIYKEFLNIKEEERYD